MQRARCWVGLSLMLAFLASIALADDTKDSKKDSAFQSSSKDPKSGKEKPPKTGTFTGRLLDIQPEQRTLKLEVILKVPQENTGETQAIADLQRKLIGNRDANSIRNIMMEIARHRQNLITYKDERKKIEFEAADDVKVRTLQLPLEYDDKGKPRKLTEEEKKALKGTDRHLPGYAVEFDSLAVGQTVEIYVPTPKKSSRTKSKTEVSEKLKALMIVILAEPEK